MPELQVDIKPRIDPAAAAQAGKQLSDQLSAQVNVRPHFDPVAREMQSMERRMARNAARVSARQQMFGESEQEALQALRLAPRDPHARIAAAAGGNAIGGGAGMLASAAGALGVAGAAGGAVAAISAAVRVGGELADSSRALRRMNRGRDPITRLEGEQQFNEQMSSLMPGIWSGMMKITGHEAYLERQIAGAKQQESMLPAITMFRSGRFAHERMQIEIEHSQRMRVLNPTNEKLADLPAEAVGAIFHAEELRKEGLKQSRRLERVWRESADFEIDATLQERNRDFSAAAKTRAVAKARAAIMSAPDAERGLVAGVQTALMNTEIAKINFEQRERARGYYSRELTGEALASSGGGMQMLAETTGRLRGLQAEMRAAPKDFMTQLAARGAYGAELRAMEASLLPRGGGFATTRAPGTEVIGDPLGIEAATRDREFSLKAIRAARTAFGDDAPVTNESRSEAMLEVLKQILSAVSTDPLSEQPVQ